jgi:O-antigen ligase
LLFTSDFNEQLRNIYNFAGITIFLFLFLKHFGLTYKSYPKLPKNINTLIVIVLVSLGISTIFSVDISISIFRVSKQLLFFLLCYFIYSLNCKLDLEKTLLSTIVFSAVILAMSVFYEFITNYSSGGFFSGTEIITRYSGFYENPNAVGLFFATAIPVSIYYLMINKNQDYYKYVWICIVVVLIISLLLGNSRSSLAALVFSIGYITFKLKPSAFKYLFFVVASIITLLLTIDTTREFIFLYIRFERILETTRNFYWEIAISIFSEHPLVGAGPGTFDLFIYKFMPVQLGGFTEAQLWWAKSGTAHNFYLFRLAEMGVIGFITALYFVYVIFHISHYLFNKITDKKDFYLLLVYKGITIGLFVRSFIETTGFLTHGWITRDLPFWIILIVILTNFKSQLSDKPINKIL